MNLAQPVLLELRMMEVAVTTGAIRCTELLSSPSTNRHPTFYRPDALPVAQSTVSKHISDERLADTFDIAMHDVILMKKVDGRENVLHVATHCDFGQTLLGFLLNSTM